MSNYILKTLNTKHFQLYEDEKMIGELTFKNRISYKAEITIPGVTTYRLEPKGIFGNKIELRDQYRILIELKQNWQGSIILNAIFENFNRTFIFKRKGVFKTGYLLTDKEGIEMIVIEQDFLWKKLNYEYRLNVSEALNRFDYKAVLIMVSAYCTIYRKRRDSEIAAGT